MQQTFETFLNVRYLVNSIYLLCKMQENGPRTHTCQMWLSEKIDVYKLFSIHISIPEMTKTTKLEKRQ